MKMLLDGFDWSEPMIKSLQQKAEFLIDVRGLEPWDYK